MKITKADVLPLALVALASVVGLTLAMTKPFLAPNEEPVFLFDNAQQEELFGLVRNEFGLFTQPTLADAWLPQGSGNLKEGRKVYEVQCLHCHGSDGGAETITANLLNPPPRDFSLGAIVRSSTPPGHPPLRDDVRMLVLEGVPNTSMKGFEGLAEADRHAAADYVMYLLIRGAVWNHALTLLEGETPQSAFDITVDEQKLRWSTSGVQQ